jgi:hypothetical protein
MEADSGPGAGDTAADVAASAAAAAAILAAAGIAPEGGAAGSAAAAAAAVAPAAPAAAAAAVAAVAREPYDLSHAYAEWSGGSVEAQVGVLAVASFDSGRQAVKVTTGAACTHPAHPA